MRYLISLGAIHAPRDMAALAALAEASGWEGVFVEDYLVYQGRRGTPTYDPWVVLAAMALATSRVRLGPLVTPLPRRRPWKLASEAVSLDHLSGGRLILGVGAGDGREPSFAEAGEPAEPRVLAEKLDEGLTVVTELWRGAPVSFAGQYYQLDGLQLTPSPAQQPRIPIWVGGDWRKPGVRRRLARWDGCCVYRGTPATDAYRPLTVEEVRAIVTLVERERGTRDGFAVCIGGFARMRDEAAERAYIRSVAEAGATWWQEWVPPDDLERARRAIGRGPLRVD
jgi:alkanesulfonate monooxygenase SsuD/methylene tetrahydromethanopterin reductase-like flavin-dependent oxidoreductase (luciferase family)